MVQYTEAEIRAAVEEAASRRTYAFAHAYIPGSITRAVRAGVRSIEHGNLIDAEAAGMMAGARRTSSAPPPSSMPRSWGVPPNQGPSRPAPTPTSCSSTATPLADIEVLGRQGAHLDLIARGGEIVVNRIG